MKTKLLYEGLYDTKPYCMVEVFMKQGKMQDGVVEIPDQFIVLLSDRSKDHGSTDLMARVGRATYRIYQKLASPTAIRYFIFLPVSHMREPLTEVWFNGEAPCICNGDIAGWEFKNPTWKGFTKEEFETLVSEYEEYAPTWGEDELSVELVSMLGSTGTTGERFKKMLRRWKM